MLGVANFMVFLVFASRHQYKRTGPDAAVAAAGTVELREADRRPEEDVVKEVVTVKGLDV
jgi:hypothetical protein